jgi:LAO/AO transport system kinase
VSDPKIGAMVERMLAGDRIALARLITQVENRADTVGEIMRAVHPHTGRAWVVGVTGPPGAGKSTLIDALARVLRAAGRTVGIVAVDPSSQFTGGAVLGDRIRMQAHALDPGVFIRSMATRGSLGGLARATSDVIKLLDGAGLQWILVETVGVGQTELDIVRQVDTTVVVLVPESGDAIQTMKAGLMEVADIFVVNKADRAGAPALAAELKFSAHLQRSSDASPKEGGGPRLAAGSRTDSPAPLSSNDPLGPRLAAGSPTASPAPLSSNDIDWEMPVVTAQAANGIGIDELLAEIRRHEQALRASGALERRRRARRRAELGAQLLEEFKAAIDRRLRRGDLAEIFEAVAAGQLDVYSAVAKILPRVLM